MHSLASLYRRDRMCVTHFAWQLVVSDGTQVLASGEKK